MFLFMLKGCHSEQSEESNPRARFLVVSDSSE